MTGKLFARLGCAVLAFVSTLPALPATAATSPVVRPGAAPNGVFSAAETVRLEAAITQIVRDDNLPSAAVGVRIPGRRDFTFVTGYANLQTRAPRRFPQPFRIASITKAFTAAALLQLIDDKRLRKADSLARWYPRFPNAAKITVDDLLRMRSGIAAPNDDEVLAAVYDDPLQKAPTLAQLMAQSAALRNNFKKPNTEGVYTDLNYFILGGIMRHVTGSEAGDLITSGIIDKLGLTETSYPTGVDLPGGLHGYGWNARTKRFEDKTAFNPPLAGTAGAMISSVGDLQTYIRILCRGGLFTQATQRAMLRGQALAGSETRYGEGVISNPGICGHSGTINGFNTDLYYFEKLDAAVVVNVNRLDKDNKPQTTPILTLVFKALEGR
jgi:D-alanyl-D-alanine carboxypeptidase